MKILYDPDIEIFSFDEVTHEEFRAMRTLLNRGKFMQELEQDREPKKLDQQTVTGWDLAAQINRVKVPGL